MNYYFYTTKGKLRIAVNEVQLSESFTPLTEEQIARYESNPNAPAIYIRDGFPEPPAAPEPISLESYKLQKIAELDVLSLTFAGVLSPSYERINAMISMLGELFNGANMTSPGYEAILTMYNTSRSDTVIRHANKVARACSTESRRVYDLILAAESAEEVDAALASYDYDGIKGEVL